MTTNREEPLNSNNSPANDPSPPLPASDRTNPPKDIDPQASPAGKDSGGSMPHTALSPEAPGSTPIDPAGLLPQGLQDRYRLLSVLGKGGFANVYLAYDKVLDQKVAIKILKFEQARADDHKRFLMEARVGAKLRHPNIAQVFDIVQTPEGLQMIMEYYPKGTLSERIKKNGVLPPLEAIHIVRQVALALAHAHSQGIIHRDVKPANIFLGDRGEVKLGDFGIAAHGEEHEYTKTGVIIGTPLYMAPEQSADSRDVDPRADIYALGLSLYHMLTGRPPRVVDLDTLPGPFRPIIRQSTAPERNKRLVSAEQFIAMLDKIEVNTSIPAVLDNSQPTVMAGEETPAPHQNTQASAAPGSPVASTMASMANEGETASSTDSLITTQSTSGISKWLVMAATLLIAIPLFSIAISLLMQGRAARQPGMAPVSINAGDTVIPDGPEGASQGNPPAGEGDRITTGPVNNRADMPAPRTLRERRPPLPVATPPVGVSSHNDPAQAASTPPPPSSIPVKEAFDELRLKNRSAKIAMQLMLETDASAPESIRRNSMLDARRRLIDEVRKTPDNPLLHLLLGYSYHKSGYLDDARREVQKARNINRNREIPIALDDRQALREAFGYKEGEKDIFGPPGVRPLP